MSRVTTYEVCGVSKFHSAANLMVEIPHIWTARLKLVLFLSLNYLAGRIVCVRLHVCAYPHIYVCELLD